MAQVSFLLGMPNKTPLFLNKQQLPAYLIKQSNPQNTTRLFTTNIRSVRKPIAPRPKNGKKPPQKNGTMLMAANINSTSRDIINTVLIKKSSSSSSSSTDRELKINEQEN